MESPAKNRQPGFTLIELLVVIAIIALLVALMLPTLGQAKSTARGALCAQKLGQMMVGWEVTMIENGGRVPNTINPGPWGGWWIMMDETIRVRDSNLLTVSDSEKDKFHCPEIFSQYGYVTSAPFVYAINCRWRPNKSWGDNEGIYWSQVRSPSTYPWFSDPEYHKGVTDYFGVVPQSRPESKWRMGFHHPNETTRTAFADGHVEAVSVDVLDGDKDSNGVPMWLFDTP